MAAPILEELNCDPGVKFLASRRVRVAFHPIPRVEKATNRSRVRAALHPLGSAGMESTGTGKIYRSSDSNLVGWSSGANTSRNTLPTSQK